MEYKRVSTQSSRVLQHFLGKDQHWFNASEAEEALPESSPSALKQLLSDMARRGLLMRLKKGVYWIVPFDQAAASFMPDWHLLAEPLTQGVAYYIGYYSALQLHGLITQPSLKEQIVVARQTKPSTIKIKSTAFQFIYHNPTHFFGDQPTWVDAFHKVQCSDLEKTIVDCLFIPAYAGGIVEVAKALHGADRAIHYNTLLDYCLRFGSQAVFKRLGFLLELLGIGKSITKALLRLRSNSYVLLDTKLPKTGPMISRWGIQQNLDAETISSALDT